MKPLIILLGVFCLTLASTKLFKGNTDFVFAGNLAMSVMLLFTAIGHFLYTKGMSMMMPSFIPFKKEAVYLTGIIEVAAAIGLMIYTYRQTTAILLILFFILILPANIHAAVKKVDYQQGTLQGPGINYLWFRIPLQVFFIAWVWYFGIYK